MTSEPPCLQVIGHRVLYESRTHGLNYNAFPSAVSLSGTEALVAFRQARDVRYLFGETRHVDANSRAVCLRFNGCGNAVNGLDLLHDHFHYGVQDPCLTRIAEQSLLLTVFYWDVFAPGSRHPNPLPDVTDLSYYEDAVRARPMGLYAMRSDDQGKTWTQPVRVGERPLALRGTAAALPGGELLLPAYTLDENSHVIIYRSTDGGQTFSLFSEIRHTLPLNETSLFLTKSGKLVAFMRSEGGQPGKKKNPLVTTESSDGGMNWSPPEERPVYSPSPFHALQLDSGRVLLSYGHRLPPYGIRACLLDADCRDWETIQPCILREGVTDDDMGYTSAVQFADGTIHITYYYHDTQNHGYRRIETALCRETLPHP